MFSGLGFRVSGFGLHIYIYIHIYVYTFRFSRRYIWIYAGFTPIARMKWNMKRTLGCRDFHIYIHIHKFAVLGSIAGCQRGTKEGKRQWIPHF